MYLMMLWTRLTEVTVSRALKYNCTEAKKGQSKNILQIPKNISNQNIFFKITVEKFDKSKKLLQILRKLVDPEITFSIIRKYFTNL